MQDIGFDIIGDLFLTPEEHFDWENKATSLYCIISGNISSDTRCILQTLVHLSKLYKGVFYVPGTLEYAESDDIPYRTEELTAIVDTMPNVILLHQDIIVADGIAIVGSNGWATGGLLHLETFAEVSQATARYEDMIYLKHAIKKLQRHLDVKNIILVTNAVPMEELYFGEEPDIVDDQIPLFESISTDTEHKISHWVFGTYTKSVDVTINNIRFINNPGLHSSIYWPKRISIGI